jgi:glycosyltransferase involved in cell wall biosynthesis
MFDFDGGGLESLVADMSRTHVRSGLSVSVVTLGGRRGRAGESVAGLLDQFHVLSPMRGVSMVLPWGVARSIRATRPHVVHLHSGAWFKGAWAARLAAAPRVVYTEHGREHRDTPASRWLDRQASRLTDAVVTVSERLERYMAAAVGVEPRRLRTIVNGVDTTRFAPAPEEPSLRSDLGIAPDGLVVGSVGRLESVKAYERLIDGVAALGGSINGRPLYVVIFGHGSRRAFLESRAAAMGLGERLRLPGWAGDPRRCYRMFDVFALTSTSEGLSVSLLEAMSCGCAPVVTDVGANRQVLGPDLAGQVVPAGDHEALVRVLGVTLGDETTRAALGNLARRRVAADYSLERMAAAYESLYRELLGGSRRR